MGEKLILIDGHSILNRAFYGVPDLTNAEGIHTNAMYGFLNIYLNFLMKKSPTILRLHLIYLHRHSDIRHLMDIKGQESLCSQN